MFYKIVDFYKIGTVCSSNTSICLSNQLLRLSYFYCFLVTRITCSLKIGFHFIVLVHNLHIKGLRLVLIYFEY